MHHFLKEQERTSTYTHKHTHTQAHAHTRKQSGDNTGLLLSQPFGSGEKGSVKMSAREKRSPG